MINPSDLLTSTCCLPEKVGPIKCLSKKGTNKPNGLITMTKWSSTTYMIVMSNLKENQKILLW